MKPFTNLEPKALLPVLGVPVLQFVLDQLASAGFHEAVVNAHHLAGRLKKGLASIEPDRMSLRLSDESHFLLGTAGGVKKAMALHERGNNGPFLLLNADRICPADLASLEQRHLELRERHGVLITMMVTQDPQSSIAYREVFIDEDQERVTGLGNLKCGSRYYAGFAVIEPEAMELISCDRPSELAQSVIEPLVQIGKVGVFGYSGLWIDIDTPQQWASAHRIIMELSVMDSLPQFWRSRIIACSMKHEEGIWSSIDSGHFVASRVRDWKRPVYWASDRIPQASVGPNTYIYGTLPRSCELHDIIAFGEVSARLPSFQSRP